LIQFLKPLKGAEEKIEVLRVGYILDITESDWYVIDINLSSIAGIAILLTLIAIEVSSIDDTLFPFSPTEQIDIVLQLGQLIEYHFVLLHLLISEVVNKTLESSMFWFSDSFRIGRIVPVIPVDGGWLVFLR
jgi:hypothetical protein